MTTPGTQSNWSEDPDDSTSELKSVDWRQIVTFTDEYDPNSDQTQEAADADAAAAAAADEPTYASELIPGEPNEREYQRDRERAYHSDLTLEEQMSQFLAAPWDEEPYEEPYEGEPVYSYAQLERLKWSDPERYQRYLDKQEAARARYEKCMEGIEFRLLDY